MTLTQNKFHFYSCKTKAHLYCPSKTAQKKQTPILLKMPMHNLFSHTVQKYEKVSAETNRNLISDLAMPNHILFSHIVQR